MHFRLRGRLALYRRVRLCVLRIVRIICLCGRVRLRRFYNALLRNRLYAARQAVFGFDGFDRAAVTLRLFAANIDKQVDKYAEYERARNFRNGYFADIDRKSVV